MSFLKKLSYENKRLVCLSYILLMPVLFDFIKVLTRSESSVYTYLIYVGSLLCILITFSRDISFKALSFLFITYLLFALSYLLFPSTNSFYSSDGFILLCLFFLPIVSLVIINISAWDNFFVIMSWFGIAASLMGVIIVFYSGVDNYSAEERYFTYMEFSYAQLPFLCSLYFQARKKKSLIYFTFFTLSLFEILALGSRASLLYTMLFILLIEFVKGTSNLMNYILYGTIIVFVIFSYNSIIDWLAGISALSDSYIMQHLLSGELFISGTRDVIYENCQNRLATMGLEVCGFFGDRPYCGSVYPHNIIYEILMQWGWIIGSIAIIYLLFMIISSFRNKSNRTISIFIITTLLGRYFLSGTYVTEGKFWIFYGCLLALTSSKTIKKIKKNGQSV